MFSTYPNNCQPRAFHNPKEWGQIISAPACNMLKISVRIKCPDRCQRQRNSPPNKVVNTGPEQRKVKLIYGRQESIVSSYYVFMKI